MLLTIQTLKNNLIHLYYDTSYYNNNDDDNDDDDGTRIHSIIMKKILYKMS